MGEKKSAGLRVPARALAAPMLAIFLGFLRSALADLSLSFEWNEPACILSDLVVIGTVVRASIAGFGGGLSAEPHHTAYHKQKRQRLQSLHGFHRVLPSLLNLSKNLSRQA